MKNSIKKSCNIKPIIINITKVPTLRMTEGGKYISKNLSSAGIDNMS
jgi:hypothetical protein